MYRPWSWSWWLRWLGPCPGIQQHKHKNIQKKRRNNIGKLWLWLVCCSLLPTCNFHRPCTSGLGGGGGGAGVIECICTLCLCCTLCVALSVFFRVCTSFDLLRMCYALWFRRHYKSVWDRAREGEREQRTLVCTIQKKRRNKIRNLWLWLVCCSILPTCNFHRPFT